MNAVRLLIASGARVEVEDNYGKTPLMLAAAYAIDEAVQQELISSGADALVLAPYIGRINQALELAAANQGKLALFGSPTLYTFQTSRRNY